MPEPSTLLILVRHGRTAWNAEGRFLGRTDLPLDEEGREQARACAAQLPWTLDAVYSSSMLRARQTARAFGEPVVVPGLQELDQGDLDGLAAAEAIERWPAFFQAWSQDPTDLRPPGSTECLRDLQQRALAALGRIAADHRGQTVAVVSHQLVLSSVLCAVHDDPLAKWRRHRLENLAVVPVRDHAGVLSLAGA